MYVCWNLKVIIIIFAFPVLSNTPGATSTRSPSHSGPPCMAIKRVDAHACACRLAPQRQSARTLMGFLFTNSRIAAGPFKVVSPNGLGDTIVSHRQVARTPLRSEGNAHESTTMNAASPMRPLTRPSSLSSDQWRHTSILVLGRNASKQTDPKTDLPGMCPHSLSSTSDTTTPSLSAYR